MSSRLPLTAMLFLAAAMACGHRREPPPPSPDIPIQRASGVTPEQLLPRDGRGCVVFLRQMGKGRIRAYVVDTDAKSVMRIIEDDRSAMLRQLEVHRLTQPNAKPILLVWVT
ncbi:MAG TPA: hypothetical protein VIG99_27130, partial [Myxococcaceae bacterium]